ncbi:hypothetical protein MTBUT4_190011 [Magnetospirillum sp. UT-4]|nr:hypothetical protein MTBUT4_190011 [Magnetospirillum sp. UT-4]
MPMPKTMEILTSVERRRRWTNDEKRQLVLATLAPGGSVASVARGRGVSASLLYAWRREVLTGAERRRFGYRRLGLLLFREGVVMNHKKLLRLYSTKGRDDPLCIGERPGVIDFACGKARAVFVFPNAGAARRGGRRRRPTNHRRRTPRFPR